MNKPILIIFVSFAFRILSQTNGGIIYDAGTIIEIQTGADICADSILIKGAYFGGGTICDGPSPVTLISFAASVEKNNVKLTWITEVEINNSGFEIERRLQKARAEWTKISFVPGNGTTQEQRTYVFEDKKLQTGIYNYRLKQIDYNSGFEYYGLNNDVTISAPKDFSVWQNYPNPSNPRSKIDYEIPENGKVTIKLYNLIGQEVVTLVNEVKEAGYYTAEFDGSNFASGVYFYRMISGKFTDIKKMILVK